MATVRDLQETLVRNNARWKVNEAFLNRNELPKFRTGGLKEKLVLAERAPKLDFRTILKVLPNNPFIIERRRARGLMFDAADAQRPVVADVQPQGGGGAPAALDWRNRWGWPWITRIRNQNGCVACWAFAAVALVEAMVRIEHCVWGWYSEGDVHKGMGSHCCDCGNPDNPLNWMKDHGAADPGCFAWPVTTSSCSGCGGSGGGPYDGIAYTPTADRSGRSVRIPAATSIGSVADQKVWLDTVGPIVTYFEVWNDFFGLGTGVYHKQTMIGTTPNSVAGGHFMLIVGYDDAAGCWIVKNSWGPTWGDHGFARIAYGETDIDRYAKTGLQGTNPDPWTKRRLHNGTMIESGNGAAHRNFEMLATGGGGGQIQHWWRDNSAADFPWHSGVTFGNDAAVCPTLISTTFNRNFESVHLTFSHRLHHWWFDQSAGHWNDGGIFGSTDTAGVPGFIQSNYGAPGNFEVVVRTGDGRLNHWWRDGGGWHDGGRFASDVAYSGAALIQSHYGAQGNFEVVCTLSSGEMQHWWRDNDHGMVWQAGPRFGSGISGPPCLIEGQFGAGDEAAVGNFELCVAAAGGQVQHWWRDNAGGSLTWRLGATFGHDVLAVVSLVEGSFGFNLEVIVLRRDQMLQHYWRDGAGWHEGTVIGHA